MSAPESDLDGLVATWVAGFGVSRRVPVRRAGAVTEVEVGGESRRLELVVVEPDEAVLSVLFSRLLVANDVWATIFSTVDTRRDLPPGVTARLTGERLMTVALAPAAHPTPAVGQVVLDADGDRALVEVRDGDVVAAQGQAALVGTDAIFDRIATHDSYRRRGLGTVVMSALSGWALQRGAERGILAASLDGQALYARLGWEPAGAMLTLAAEAVPGRPHG